MTGAEQKRLGAYYTSLEVAEFLARWAIRARTDSIIDPSFGEGALLRAAARRLAELGADPRDLLKGVEKNWRTHRNVSATLSAEKLARRSNLRHSDFFEVEAPSPARTRVVLANPPFIRFHRFNGKERRRALECAADAGVRLSGQSSAWAPFVIHATRFLECGGRLALVLPTELLHAQYAQPVLRFLALTFGSLVIVRFEKRLFPELHQDAVLVLADDKGSAPRNVLLLTSRRPSHWPHLTRWRLAPERSWTHKHCRTGTRPHENVPFRMICGMFTGASVALHP